MSRTHEFSFSRFWAMVVKEFVQMRRDRLTFGMMIGIPLIQLVLFGYAINSDPKHLPTAVLLASLPESVKEAGSQRGEKALASLSHYFGRIQALWKPVATEEAFEIVRRRLFSNINDKLAMESVNAWSEAGVSRSPR